MIEKIENEAHPFPMQIRPTEYAADGDYSADANLVYPRQFV